MNNILRLALIYSKSMGGFYTLGEVIDVASQDFTAIKVIKTVLKRQTSYFPQSKNTNFLILWR